MRPLQVGLTFLALVALAFAAILLTLTKRLTREIGQALGAEDATLAAWTLGRWPLVLALGALVTVGLYRLAPRRWRQGVGIVSVGAFAAVMAWTVSTVGFEVWVGNFVDYDATYGALAGSVALAVWLWISNIALLFGMLLDLELSPGSEDGSPRAAG